MTCPQCKTDSATIIGQHGEGRNKVRTFQCETCRMIFERLEVSHVHAFREALRDRGLIR